MAGSRQTTSEDNYTGQLLARLAARGARDTIVYGERRISGREANDLVLRYAGALIALGVDQDDGVALFSVNTPETLLLTLAVHFLGGRLVFVPPEPGNRELGSFIERADVKLLILDPVFTGRAAQLAEETRVVTYSLGPADGAPNFLAAVNPLTELAPEDVAPASAVATLFYTGDITGQPKLVPHGHGSYERIVKAADTHGSDAADPRLLAGTLLSHVSGHLTALTALFAGQTVVLMRGESFVTGRTSDNVYSRLLDDFLCTLPGIRQAAAVGVPDRVVHGHRQPALHHGREGRQEGAADRAPPGPGGQVRSQPGGQLRLTPPPGRTRRRPGARPPAGSFPATPEAALAVDHAAISAQVRSGRIFLRSEQADTVGPPDWRDVPDGAEHLHLPVRGWGADHRVPVGPGGTAAGGGPDHPRHGRARPALRPCGPGPERRRVRGVRAGSSRARGQRHQRARAARGRRLASTGGRHRRAQCPDQGRAARVAAGSARAQHGLVRGPAVPAPPQLGGGRRRLDRHRSH
jgi:hypothetical protein